MTSFEIPKKPIVLDVAFDPLHPFTVPASGMAVPASGMAAPAPHRDRFEVAAAQKKTDVYRPPDWQFYATTHVVDADNMAGFANDGVHYDGVSTTAGGDYRVSMSGFSTGSFGPPLELGAQYVRKRPIWDVGENGQPQFNGEYVAVGPSLRFSASIQELTRDDYHWETTFDDSQIQEILGDSANAVTGSFNTDVPEPNLSDPRSYPDDLEAWTNENMDRVEGIPNLLEGIWSTYDPSSDFHSEFDSGESYGVPVVRLNVDVGGELTHWNSRKWIQGPSSFRVSAVGSLFYLGGPNTAVPVFLGIGPQMELTALTVNVHPKLALSAYGYLGVQYFHGFTWEGGFTDNDSMFLSSNLGVGVKGTFPAIRDPGSVRRNELLSGGRESFDDVLKRIYNDVPDLGNVSSVLDPPVRSN